MIPWIIFAVVLVPLVVIGFAALRRRTAISEHPPTEDAAARARTADEFAQAEAYEEQWHSENKGRDSARRFP